jgi:hypothetical protein
MIYKEVESVQEHNNNKPYQILNKQSNLCNRNYSIQTTKKIKTKHQYKYHLQI